METSGLDQDMAGRASAPEGPSAEGFPTEWARPADQAIGDRILSQADIDRMLGFQAHEASGIGADGLRAMAGSGLATSERLPVLEAVFERAVRLLSTSLRGFLGETVDVRLDGLDSARFEDYLDAVPLPAQFAVFRAEGWGDAGLVTVPPRLAYATFDVLLGGKNARSVPQFEGRPFTAIEMQLAKGLVELVLRNLEAAFQPLGPVRFVLERLERDPRSVGVTRPANAAVVAEIGIDMDGRGGPLHVVLPYVTIEPIRDLLQQGFVGEALERDRVWENHLATELWQAEVAVDAVLHETRLPLRKVLSLEVGDTVIFEARPNDLVAVRCGNWTLTEGRIGRMDDNIAIQVARPLRRSRTSFAAFEAGASGPKEGEGR